LAKAIGCHLVVLCSFHTDLHDVHELFRAQRLTMATAVQVLPIP
jgi:hypothetical protein